MTQMSVSHFGGVLGFFHVNELVARAQRVASRGRRSSAIAVQDAGREQGRARRLGSDAFRTRGRANKQRRRFRCIRAFNYRAMNRVPGAVPAQLKPVSQSVSYFTVPPRAQPSTGSQSGSAAPGLTQVPSTRSRGLPRTGTAIICTGHFVPTMAFVHVHF